MTRTEEDWADLEAELTAFIHSERRRYGPGYTQLGYGAPTWRGFKKFFAKYGTFPAIAVVALGWYGFPLVVLGVFLLGATIFAYRISQFSGSITEDFVEHWGAAFLVASLVLIVGSWIILRLGGSSDNYGLLVMIYLVVIIFTLRDLMLDRPLLWRDAYSLNGIADLEKICKDFREDIANKQVSKEPVNSDNGGSKKNFFDGDLSLDQEGLEGAREKFRIRIPRRLKKLDLKEAWEYRDTEEVSIALTIVEKIICEFWGFNIYRLDEFVQRRHLAHAFAERFLLHAEWTLERLGFDLRSVALSDRPEVCGEKYYTIPRSLQRGAIARQKRAFSAAGGRAIASATMGQMHPLLALAVMLAAIIGAQVYDSRALRRLKDAEGQLKVTAKAVSGDNELIETLIMTRFVPDMERLTTSVKLMDDLSRELNEQRWRRQAADPKKTMSLAIAYLEAKQVLEIEERTEREQQRSA